MATISAPPLPNSQIFQDQNTTLKIRKFKSAHQVKLSLRRHLNITLRQQDRLCVSCFNKFGFALPMKPDFHRRLRCSLPELNLLANLHHKNYQTDQKLLSSRTCALVAGSRVVCRGDGGRGSRTSPSPPSSPPLSLPSLGMQVDPAPGLLAASLRPPWQIYTNQRSPVVADDAFLPF